MANKREYEVGKGKPPDHTRFQKGQSGNPKGRRKGSKNVATTLEEVLRERVPVTENGKRKSITKLEAMLKQLANQAASGDHRAIKLLIPLAQTCLGASASGQNEALQSAPLPSDDERKARSLETIRILKEIGFFEGIVEVSSTQSGPQAPAEKRDVQNEGGPK